MPGATLVNVVCLYTAKREALDVIRSVDADAIAANSNTQSAENGNNNSILNRKATVHGNKAWANCITRFWGAPDDEYRNRTFKLFPRMVKASWAIQAAVGTKPALIGNKKLELKYIRGKDYLEVDIDMSSSTIATHILGMVSVSLNGFVEKYETEKLW